MKYSNLILPELVEDSSELFFATSLRGNLRSCPSELRGKSKKNSGLFFATSLRGNLRSCPSELRGKSKKTRGLF
jgi:hypothetical protein